MEQKLSFTEARDRLRKWREENVRCSQDIVDCYEEIAPKLNKLGDEKYLVLEQVTVAALDCHRLEIASECLQTLHSHFPGSVRVRCLDVLGLQTIEKHDAVKQVLETIIQLDNTNPIPRKREIALYISQGKIQHAIKMLTEYLKKFMADQEAWQELSTLYLLEQDFAKAAFCAEELILHDPHSHLLHQYLAEIRYTQGGFENLELARAHYCMAIKLNPNNMRALYGLLLTVSNIAISPKCTALKKKEALKLQSWVAKSIQNRYKAVAQKPDLDAVDSLFSALQISKINALPAIKPSLSRSSKEKNFELSQSD